MPLPEGLDMLMEKSHTDSPDYLCKWCLTYVGQRRQFCSADCAAQFKLCQRRREQKQNLNISVDYYGNVKLSIQGLPISGSSDSSGGNSNSTGNSIAGGGRRGRRRRRCRNCAKLLTDDAEEEFCDESCLDMFEERSKKDDFVNIFQQKEAAERRRIRKWLTDAQDQYSRQIGDTIPDSARSLGHGQYSFRRIQHVPESTFRLQRDEVITGGPVTLNPIPLRKGPLRPSRRRNLEMDSDKRHLMIDLKWIPKFNL